jgi:hypothetical protein
MKLKLFKPTDLEAVVYGKVGITLRTDGVFSFSVALTELMGLKADDKVLIAQDEEKPLDWYILKHEEGFILRHPGKEKKGVSFSNKRLRKIILEAVLFEDKTCSFLVAKEPTEIDGVKYWAIITKSVKASTRPAIKA